MDRLAVSRALDHGDLDVDVVFARTVSEAWRHLDTDEFDCVLTDFGLPDGDGFEVIQYVAKRDVATPVVMLTGRGDERLAVELMRKGARDYIAKSHLSPARVSQSIRQAVELARTERLARRAMENRRLLAITTELLLRSLNFRENLSAVARLLVEEYAAACRIDVTVADEPRFVVAAVEASLEEAADARTAESATDSLSSVGDHARTLAKPWAWPPSAAGSNDSEGIGVPEAWPVGMAVPFAIRQAPAGVLTLARDDPRKAFDEFDVSFAQLVADHLATAIDNAHLFEGQRRAVQARDEVLAVVSHDLRNPLNAVSAGTRLVLEVPLPEEKKREQLEIVVQAADRMNHMIQDLLDVSQMEARTFSIRAAPVRPADVVRHAVSLARADLERADMDVQSAVAADLPKVSADLERLLRVFGNLLGNAAKFAKSGSTVTVAAREEGRFVRFDISDQGPGIPEEELTHLFDRFWQGRSQRRSGAGLGLAIARGITEAHGGSIWVESVEGEGSTFSFTIPTAAAEAVAPARQSASEIR